VALAHAEIERINTAYVSRNRLQSGYARMRQMDTITFCERASPNHAPRGDPPRIDMLVVHYTGMREAAAALDRLCDPTAQVSAHYLVEEDGTIWRLVPEIRRAFHAGVSCWEGERDLNFVSIGVEIVNPGHEWGYCAFADTQIAATERLCREILSRHPIPGHRVVGHSDIAPDRKADPGELFDWPRLARAGIGIWPKPRGTSLNGPVDRARALADLAAIGYCLAAEERAIAAFQRRFRPARVDGVVDSETAARLGEVRVAFAHSRDRRISRGARSRAAN
jgi:N-acetylmuramoyl-L-alanine amidase